MQNQKILNFLKQNVGRDFTEYDALGCADTVNNILKECLGYVAGGGPSTNKMIEELRKNKNFREVTLYETLAGDIIISPTGYGNGSIKNGHVGFLGENGEIYSNNSSTSKLDTHLTAIKWKEYFKVQGGYPVFYYRAIANPVVNNIPKILQSSKDETKISLTTKGTAVTIIMFALQSSGLGISLEDTKVLQDNLTLLIPILVTIWGVVRKFL